MWIYQHSQGPINVDIPTLTRAHRCGYTNTHKGPLMWIYQHSQGPIDVDIPTLTRAHHDCRVVR
jgi:hypothetical protein